ncbi:MAG: flagellar protein FlaG [Gammaproteobacteria bacterium]
MSIDSTMLSIQTIDASRVQGSTRTNTMNSGTDGASPIQQAEKRISPDLVSSVNPDSVADEVATAVIKISEYVQNLQRDLQFNIDKESGRVVVRVIDSETDELIRQIPSEEVLALAKRDLFEGFNIIEEEV